MFDLGRFAQVENKLPYAGYSSFHSSRFRAARDAEGVASGAPRGDFSAPGFAYSGNAHPSFKGTGAGRLSDGTPIHNSAPVSSLLPSTRFRSTPSPYIPGITGKFFDFFGGGGGEGSESSG